MDRHPVEIVLKDDSHIERVESKELRSQALKLVQEVKDKTRVARLSDTILELLTQVIRPLFSRDRHTKLTSTGRKKLVDQTLPKALERFSSDALFDPDMKPIWKNGWTGSLLRHVLSLYTKIEESDLRRKTLEAHFHLIVPPILHQVDDIDILYKASGCQCLQLLCDVLYQSHSEILKRSGLADVFIGALKNNFSYLPTLTPEDDSLMLYRALYPAFRSLIKARFSFTAPLQATESSSKIIGKEKLKGSSKTKSAKSEEELRESYLTLILRHQLIYSLSHLSIGTGTGGTMSLQLSVYFISQFSWIFAEMGIATTIHLQTVLPLLRNILSDPFVAASPEMLLETLKALSMIIRMTWPRIRQKWWSECLRGVVNCWLSVIDDGEGMEDVSRKQSLMLVKHELKIVTCLLEDVVGESFSTTSKDLILEEPLLEELFDGKI